MAYFCYREEFRNIFKDGEYVVVSPSDHGDNSKDSEISAAQLEEKINEKGFAYNKFSEKTIVHNAENPKITRTKKTFYFVVKAEDAKDEILEGCTINRETENFIIGQNFMLPLSESERQKFVEKHIIFPENILIFPNELGDWQFLEEKRIYMNKYRNSIIALVSCDCVSVGSCIPVGVTIKKQPVKSYQEGFDFLKSFKLKLR